MNYELAEELKAAGFPQIGQNKVVPQTLMAGEFQPTRVGEVDQSVYYPNLSELIRACGERFNSLRQTHDGMWAAYQTESNVAQIYETPEEAVARLWLALNKK